ncbi:UPF0104 family protein [Leptolyngbya sp. FACHB-17]|uniref:UPF0104 family protein n=1 Tax=unclassified Leptolyngbya TaxID=2650499 RepID=UPI00167FEAE2|nr:UPF0104 family protein [Leptolyngbya sp. FACHB-17]MBD2082731.1 UPF0104 family protein [Leptolyngbya sp. FACHB-17]
MQRFRAKWFKSTLRWLILTAVVFFLFQSLQKHWQEVTKLRIDGRGIACLAVAIGVTLFAHIFAGYVWSWILGVLSYRVSGSWGAQTYLKTNIAKYLPGNVWHFYGRINAAKQIGIAIAPATLSILLESLLMAGAACFFAMVRFHSAIWLQCAIVIVILIAIHPVFLNVALKQASKLKQSTGLIQLDRYPLLPLLGELGFLGLRAVGFILTFLALRSISSAELPLLFSGFAWAWLLGFIIPGLPGGIGVFEAIAVAIFSQAFPSAQVLAVVALYRFVNTLAEAMGAGLAAIDERWSR